jgi:hypothetical protein
VKRTEESDGEERESDMGWIKEPCHRIYFIVALFPSIATLRFTNTEGRRFFRERDRKVSFTEVKHGTAIHWDLRVGYSPETWNMSPESTGGHDT